MVARVGRHCIATDAEPRELPLGCPRTTGQRPTRWRVNRDDARTDLPYDRLKFINANVGVGLRRSTLVKQYKIQTAVCGYVYPKGAMPHHVADQRAVTHHWVVRSPDSSAMT